HETPSSIAPVLTLIKAALAEIGRPGRRAGIPACVRITEGSGSMPDIGALGSRRVDLVDLRAIITAHKRWLRNERGGKRADFTWRSFHGLDLRNAALSRAKLTGAQLIRCDLSQAKLVEADLFGINLTESVLRHADCRNANFRGAHLPGADFSDAKLTG